MTEIIYTPKDFEGDYNAKFGAAFGLMPTLAQSNYYRPPNVSRDYKICILLELVFIQGQECQLY